MIVQKFKQKSKRVFFQKHFLIEIFDHIFFRKNNSVKLSFKFFSGVKFT